jgi:hypothetical protein
MQSLAESCSSIPKSPALGIGLGWVDLGIFAEIREKPKKPQKSPKNRKNGQILAPFKLR